MKHIQKHEKGEKGQLILRCELKIGGEQSKRKKREETIEWQEEPSKARIEELLRELLAFLHGGLLLDVVLVLLQKLLVVRRAMLRHELRGHSCLALQLAHQ